MGSVHWATSVAVLIDSLIRGPQVSFLWRCSEILLPIFWWPVAIRINVMHWLWVPSLIVVVARSWSFIRLCHFPLLLKLVKMLDLRLAKFHELFIELLHYFGLLSDKMTMQGSHAQGFDSLSNDLTI
jgi:hypothetical protein